MKKVITLILILSFLMPKTYGQNTNPNPPRNSFKFGIGTTYLRPVNILGSNTLHAQYEHTLFKPVRIFVDGFQVKANQVKDDGNEAKIKAYQIDAGLNLALLSNKYNAFKIGGGATWQRLNHEFTTSVELDSNNNIVNKVFDENQWEGYGWMANIEYEVYVVDHIVLGSRLTYKKYQNGDENYYFGLNAGFRF